MGKNKLAAGAVVLAVAVGGVATTAVSAAPTATYKLSADKSKLKFNKSTIRAKAGKVTLSMSNPSSLAAQHRHQGQGHGQDRHQGRHLDLLARRSRRAPTPSTAASARTRRPA